MTDSDEPQVSPNGALEESEDDAVASGADESVSHETAEAADTEPAPEPVPAEAPAGPPPEPAGPEPTRAGMAWYVLRVASNKEDQVREALEKKVKIEGLTERIGRILVPTQKEKRLKGGQARVYEKKLYPGYVFVEMATDPDGSIPENVWFLVKETLGVGDFIGSDGKPTSMRDVDVDKMLLAAAAPETPETLAGLNYQQGDRVKIKEGSFEGYEGAVDAVDEQKGMVTVLLTIFGRSTPVDVEYWQLERV
jgi:transcriptional antiterminator NusG